MVEINKPKLRFKEFKDDWESKKIGDIANIVGGGTPKTDVKEYWNGSINWFSPNELNGSPYVDNSTKKITELGLKKSSAKLHPANTVLFTSRAGIGKMAILKQPATTNQGFQSLELKNGYYPYFIYSYNYELKKKAIRLSSGSTFDEISKSSMESIKLSVPTFDEQRQIGLLFNKIDKLIELKGNKIAILERLKRGYLQKLFTDQYEDKPKLRFKGFDNNWDIKQLKDIGQFKSGYGFPDKEQGGKSGIPFFKVSDMANNKSKMKKSNNYVNEKQIIDNSWKLINPENSAIIFAKVGAALNKNRKRIVNKPFLIDNNIMAYSFDDSWSSLFGFSLFLTLFLPKYAQVGALPSFNAGDIGSINVRVPALEEQRKIGKTMDLIDKQINLQQKESERLKSLKKGYLQKMFV